MVTVAEAQVLNLPASTPLGNLSADDRQRVAVERSKTVGLHDLYHEIEQQYDALPPRDQVGRGVLEDILNVERELRQNAERMARDYRALVVELAQRFAGEALEARRRDNPAVPSAWTAADWTAFWEDVSLRPAGGWTVRQDGNGHEALERRIV